MFFFIVSMTMNIEERISWYGILKSIGLKNSTMRKMVFLQCCIVGGIGGIVGVIFSKVVITIINLGLANGSINFKNSAFTSGVGIISTIAVILITYFIVSFKLGRINIIKAITKN